jgi:site-specific DNA-methyltransferase (adenine-specific)
MFSFAGDIVLDPFAGTFSTTIAALRAGRNSIGVELDPTYFVDGARRVNEVAARLRLFAAAPTVEVNDHFPSVALQ